MAEIFAYILGASHITDGIECYVPEMVDTRNIFFGPCKSDLRKELRTRFLKIKDTEDVSDSGIYLIGFNASNPEKERRIVWTGKIKRVMTFEFAWKFFMNKSIIPRSLHLKPLSRNGQLIGYQHIGELHLENDKWIWDIINKRRAKTGNLYSLKDSELILKDTRYRQQLFERDCCFICDKLFFAGNGVEGIKITNDFVDILRKTQPGKEIDDYYVFGPRCSQGFTLHITDQFANRLVELLKHNARDGTETFSA